MPALTTSQVNVGFKNCSLRFQRAPRWSCDCGEQLVDDDWSGRAMIRCSQCGTRWGLEADLGEGRQWWVSGPTAEWLAAHALRVEDPYGNYPPEIVVEQGLPAPVDGIEPGMCFPLAVWRSGSWAAVLYLYRNEATEFDLPGDEYGCETEHLRFDLDHGWMSTGGGGGDWVNAFSPPQSLLDKYVVLGTGITETSDDDEDLRLAGGLCSGAVAALELVEDGDVSRFPIDQLRRTFLVGTTAGSAHLRFLDRDGRLLHDRRGNVLEVILAERSNPDCPSSDRSGADTGPPGTMTHEAPGPSGGSGIRTHGELPHTRFPSVPIRPLSHPSRSSACYRHAPTKLSRIELEPGTLSAIR